MSPAGPTRGIAALYALFPGFISRAGKGTVMDENTTDTRAAIELQKLKLEVQRLELEVANTTRMRRFELLLRLLPTVTILVTVLGFAFSVWQYPGAAGS